MNSIWNTNLALFEKRFPALRDLLSEDIAFFEGEIEAGKFPLPLEIIEAKNGSPTAIYKAESAQALPLHSKYNPEREAEQLVHDFSSKDFEAAVFLGFGLGYGPLAFAEANPSTPLILIEKDPLFLFAAMNTLDFSKVFSHPKLIFVTKADPQTAISVLANYKAERVKIFSSKAHTAHDSPFAEEFLELFKRSLQKDEINTNTLEKFSRLWMKNSLANLPYLSKCDGVKKYRSTLLQLGGKATELPFVILAAGPSLQTLLPHLPALKETCVLVCVDSALHAVLKAGVEPDFIVLVDPQYVCARHLEFLKAPSSVLITESAAYPSVFRFECRETVMCSSLFPIGQYFEKRLGQKGKLGAGGSVATTAWDFARTCGTRKIYLAGMDLGFPGKQTHIRGSQFEERAHRTSTHTHTAETDGVASLLGAAPSLAKDYRGNTILTDKRMSLFAWWFESNCATALKDGQNTYTLTPQSLAIPNIGIASPEEVLAASSAKKEELMEAKRRFFEQAEKNSLEQKDDDRKKGVPSFESVFDEFRESLENLMSLSKKGLNLCQSAIQNRTKVHEVNAKLSEIDSQILNSAGKDAAALVFPTERQLAAKAKELPSSAMNDAMLKPIYYSRLIYSELQKAVGEYLGCLKP
ncbi:MAG: motility associated factor glycosyltransferase family protein [Treponema sp.]|nr:motility associated factor glycosyltransferase family protein [Treponema sp.]